MAASQKAPGPRRVRASAGQPSAGSWTIPEVTAQLRQRIGSSPLDEFVAAHGPADILRELVQNEFDGDGSDIGIRFGADALEVTGAGRAINAKGWTRLSVLMGTGEVLGDASHEVVDAKENGIGSKNFGLRSLFSFGDRIHVRSNGRMAMLDIREFGAGRQVDPTSAGQIGVRVQVPYRTKALRKLEPFTVERETSAIGEIASALLPTLVKLALGGKRPGIRSLTVTSERTGRELRWRQSGQTVSTRLAGITVTRRSGRLKTLAADGARGTETYEELEFSRYIEIPNVYANLPFPSYYRSGRRVRIALSLPMRGEKVVLTRPGYFYYPLQAGQARTGAPVSVSAPFEMDGERTRPNNTKWNEWLKAQAAALAVDLVGADWFGRFGADAYAALCPIGTEETGSFQALVLEGLKTSACWPSQAAGGLAKASALSVPDYPALEGHIAASGYLDRRLAVDARTATLARACGAKRFSINSLVRLRCGGETDVGLATRLKPDEEANYRYTPYPGALNSEAEQTLTASALTTLQKNLSNQNRQDLRETTTTLAADGQLQPAWRLTIVPADMWEGCPAPVPTRLHPQLRDLKAVSRYCETFHLGRWVLEAAERATNGTISDAERQALYHHILAPDTKFTPKALAAIRRSPVIKDEAGEWAAPEDLALLPARDAAVLDLVVKAPAAALRKRPELLKRLAIRRKIIGNDMVRMAPLLADNLELADEFEALMRRNIELMSPKVVASLASHSILRARSGNLATPGALHLLTPINLACLEDADLLVAGDSPALYRRLDCRAQPSVKTLLSVVERCRTAGMPPPRPDQFYPALVEALRRERLAVLGLSQDAVLWVDGAYVTPHACLATSRAPRCLQGAVPILRQGGVVADAYQTLGASIIPRDHHWSAFFRRISAQADARGGAPLLALDKVFLVEAYQRRGALGLPADLPATVRCLLSDKGTAHSLSELQADTFLENDYPDLADALVAANAGIAFADRAEHSRIFMRALGLSALSQVVSKPRVTIGTLAPPPNWFHASVSEKALALLHRTDLAQAISELAYAHQKQAPEFQPAFRATLRNRLAAIQRVTFVREITRTYRLGKSVSVQADAAVDGDQLALRPPRYRSEYEHVLAMELAQLAGATQLPDIRALASAILPLLHATSNPEILGYLRRLGIQPKDWQAEDAQSTVQQAEEEAEQTREDIVRGLMDSVRVEPASPATPPSPIVLPPQPPLQGPSALPPSPPPSLPPVDAVVLSVSTPESTAPPPSASIGSSPGSRLWSTWTPRTPAEIERDQKIGVQGEALVYRQELERVRKLGYDKPEEHVVWTSRSNAGADHDIRSINADGGPLWIEVKSTTGVDGRFDWSIAEFQKALSEGPRYELWRVYEADTKAPKAKVFRDPAALLRTSVLRLEIGVLRAFVESK
jgi:hypothetical protein